MTLFRALLLGCLPGLAGGFVNAISLLVESGKNDQGKYSAARGVSHEMYVTSKCLVGLGGALAFFLVLIWVGKFPDNPTKTSEFLFLITLSFVSGFVGDRILSKVASGLENQIAQALDKQIPDLKKDVQKDVDPKMRAALAVMSALTNLNNAAGVLPQTFSDDARDLEQARKEVPLHRQVNILLGRVYAEGLKDYNSGIKVLGEFIEKKKAAGQGSDKDVADALFNRACYLSRKAEALSGDEQKAILRQSVADLEQSLTLSPDNLEDAKRDRDLNLARETEEGKKLLKK
jgi:hypothetical protein